jgi:restriction endonuclease S subunit
MGSEWTPVILRDLLETIIDYRGKTPPKSATGIPVLTAASVKNGKVLKDKVSYISEDTYRKVTTRGFPKEGDVLITTEAPCGEVAPFPNDKKYHITRRIMALRGDASKIDSDFLLYTLMSNVCQNQIYARVRGTTVPRVLKTDITGLEFKIPSLKTQKKIGAFIRSIDNKIAINQQINQTLEKMAQTLFKSWFVDFDPVIDNALAAGNPIPDELQHHLEVRQKVRDLGTQDSSVKPLPVASQRLFPSEFEQCGDYTIGIKGWLPKGWGLVKFKDAVDKYIDNRGKTPPLSESGYPLIEVKNMPDASPFPSTNSGKRVALEVFETWFRAHVEERDILISTVGTIGRTSYVKNTEIAIAQNVLGLRFGKKLSPEYMYYLIKSHKFQFDMDARLVTTVQSSIKRKDLNTIDIVVPTQELQNRFESIVKP